MRRNRRYWQLCRTGQGGRRDDSAAVAELVSSDAATQPHTVRPMASEVLRRSILRPSWQSSCLVDANTGDAAVATLMALGAIAFAVQHARLRASVIDSA
jgi:hypothetical protein